MTTPTQQLMGMMSPQQARLLDDQLREQQIQQQAGGGLFSGAVASTLRGNDMLGNAFMGRQVGANESETVKKRKDIEEQIQAEKLKQSQELKSVKSQALAALENSDLTPTQKANLTKIIEMDNSGKRAAAVIDKYGMPTKESAKGFSTANVGDSLYSFNKDDGTWKLIAQVGQKDKKGNLVSPKGNSKTSKAQKNTLDEISRVAIENILKDKDLSSQDRAQLMKDAGQYRKDNPEHNASELAVHLSEKAMSLYDLQDAAQAEKARKRLNTDVSLTLDTIDIIMEAAGDTTEWDYLFGQYIPGTTSKSIQANLKNLFATISFDKLSRMRSESKTGGALGNVSNYEIGLLENSLLALDPLDDNFKSNLQKVKKHYETIMMLYSGNEETARAYIQESDDYSITPNGMVYHMTGGRLNPSAREVGIISTETGGKDGN